MKRNAAHGDFGALSLASSGQGDIQRGSGFFRVLEKHFVKIAHAIKQQAIGMRRLDGHILGHHRGVAFGGEGVCVGRNRR